MPANAYFTAAGRLAPVGRLSALLIAALLAGCASQGHQDASAKTVEPLPADPSVLVLGAESALQRGQYREASQAYVRAAQASRDEALAEQATRTSYEHHQWTLVLAGAERWLELNHTNEEARRFAAFSMAIPRSAPWTWTTSSVTRGIIARRCRMSPGARS